MAGLTDQSDSSDSSGSLLSQINVTPFVDVVLVLLVIFMVTAPMMMKEYLDLNLPQTQTSDGKKVQSIGIAVNRNGNYLWNGEIIDLEEVKNKTRSVLASAPDSQAIISADEEVAYKYVVKVIDALKTAGLQKFAIQIEKQVEGSP